MSIKIVSILAVALIALVGISFTGCSENGAKQIAPNPEAKVLTPEEREAYNKSQADMMNPNKN